MDTNEKEKEQQRHQTNANDSDKPEPYDPDQYIPKSATIEGYEEDVFLEKVSPEKGYSTDPKQGMWDASQHIADEDVDRVPDEDQEKEAQNMKESFEKSQENKDN
ncbi:hypothetical protein [Arundinibacter roseus]|uniref:Uncharacterized protein n=1 Tax=Arundinibacter roseus TaxID=2070510 RepID=A0A4R4KI85_9BACT|nr:hypothetical protein [Arundinibacter roseus]TDB67860.1 hypothetical protein EZE20_02745 [Arundinibacter roseus]